jgi:uncharacterized protein with PIN domain
MSDANNTDPDLSVRVEFPQYAAKMEFIGEPPNVTVIVRCPLCDKEVLRRSWFGFEPIEPEIPESDPRVQARLANSHEDREIYWKHLATTHPEETT